MSTVIENGVRECPTCHARWDFATRNCSTCGAYLLDQPVLDPRTGDPLPASSAPRTVTDRPPARTAGSPWESGFARMIGVVWLALSIIAAFVIYDALSVLMPPELAVVSAVVAAATALQGATVAAVLFALAAIADRR